MSDNASKDSHPQRSARQRHRNAAGRERSGSRARGGPRRGYSESRPHERARHSTPSRLAAYEARREVAEKDAYANLIFSSIVRRHRLQGRDAAFATELFYGSLRAQGRLDAVLSACVDRPWERIEPPVQDVLRLGAYQMLDMAVPAHAAASETVGLARHVTGAGSATLVNAVLRRVSEKTPEQWLDELAPRRHEGHIPDLAIAHSHPEWIVRALRDALIVHGRDESELADLLAAHNLAPKVSLVMRPGLTDGDELAAHGAGESRYSLMAASWPGGDPATAPPVAEGRAGIQDEGSQLVALALAMGADTLVQADDAHWLDLCAGPGGKTALLAGLSVDHDASVLAVEIQDHRRELVEKSVHTLREAGADVRAITADGTTMGSLHPGEFSRVLADVPCSGLGALRRRPEARWRKQPSDLGPLGKLQRALLDSAIDATAPGGVIAYVTCSPHPAETVLVIKSAMRARSDIEIVDAREPVRAAVRSGVDIELGEGPWVQLWPHIHTTDAMFLTLIRKSSAPSALPSKGSHDV